MRRRALVQIRRYARHVLALVAVIAIGTTCGVLILQSQRLANPFASYYTINAEFPSATAVVAGLGEPVNVAGVRVGSITGTSLRGGVAVIHMQIDPDEDPPDLSRGACRPGSPHAARGHAGQHLAGRSERGSARHRARRSRSARRSRRSAPTSCWPRWTPTPGPGSRACSSPWARRPRAAVRTSGPCSRPSRRRRRSCVSSPSCSPPAGCRSGRAGARLRLGHAARPARRTASSGRWSRPASR